MKPSIRLGLWAVGCVGLIAAGCMSGALKSANSSKDSQETPAAVASNLEAPSASTEPLPFKIVELNGPPIEMGQAHGKALSASIKTLQHQYLMKFIPEGFDRFVAFTAAEGFRERMLPEHRDEVAGLVEGAQTDGRETLLAQCFLDLSGMIACSTITLPASSSPDGIARFGRNLDFPSLNVIDKYSMLFIYRPEGKYAFASVGWPGLIGVLSGMNEHGLTIASMEITRGRRLPQAMPYMLLYRAILEQCRTTDEALAMLERTPRQTANNLMIMDAAGNRALAEITPEKVTVRRGDDFGLISTNHHRGARSDNSLGRCRRYDGLRTAAVMQRGKIGVPELQHMLQKASQKNETLQSMVFEPGNRVMYLATGANAATTRFHRIDLAAYFQQQKQY